jgi:hypothetical protein
VPLTATSAALMATSRPPSEGTARGGTAGTSGEPSRPRGPVPATTTADCLATKKVSHSHTQSQHTTATTRAHLGAMPLCRRPLALTDRHPVDVGCPSQLHLSLTSLKLTSIPAATGSLRHVTHLDLSNNKLLDIPAGALPPYLVELTLTGNLLEELPNSLVSLAKLVRLFAGANRCGVPGALPRGARLPAVVAPAARPRTSATARRLWRTRPTTPCAPPPQAVRRGRDFRPALAAARGPSV